MNKSNHSKEYIYKTPDKKNNSDSDSDIDIKYNKINKFRNKKNTNYTKDINENLLTEESKILDFDNI